MAVEYTDNGVPYSSKTRDLQKTLSALNISNLQAMKLLSDAYSVKAQLGRKKGGKQSGGKVNASLASLGSSVQLPNLKKKRTND